MATQLKTLLKRQASAYRQLVQGANTLLESANLFWTECLLLRLVRHLYRRRIEQLGEIDAFADEPESEKTLVALTRPPVDDEQVLKKFSKDMADKLNAMAEEKRAVFKAALRENMVQAQVEAALQGHELEPWVNVDEDEDRGRKWQATCRRMSVYVSNKTLYSLLEEECEG